LFLADANWRPAFELWSGTPPWFTKIIGSFNGFAAAYPIAMPVAVAVPRLRMPLVLVSSDIVGWIVRYPPT
jgi:hypothetical protein